MEPVTYVASTTVSTTPVGVPSVGFDIFDLFLCSETVKQWQVFLVVVDFGDS